MAKGIYYGVKKTLPSGYTQVEYIESTGTQYIDTGFKPNSNTRIVAEMAYVSFSNNTCGLIGSSASSGIEFYYYSSTVSQRYIYMFNATDNNSASAEVALGKKLHIDLAKTKATVTVDGSVYTMTPSSAADFSASYTLHIHTLWRNGAALLGSYSRTYSFMIYDNGKLVRDFIPCKNSSGVGGLYDFVSGVFYTDASGGSFVVGGSVADGSLPSVARKVKKMYRGVEKFAKRNLPSGYTQVEYIEATGTQYIDTGFVPNQDTRVFCEAVFAPETAVKFLFGARTSTSSNQFMLACDSSGKYTSGYGGESKKFTAAHGSTDIIIVDKDKETTTITHNDGTTASVVGTESTFTAPNNMVLFGCNTKGTVTSSKARIYSFQVYDNGLIVRDFVPCTNSSGVGGLYDVVNGAFYADAAGGSFVVGSSAQSVARKIKKAYIGIGGVARPFFSGGELAYYGTATALSKASFGLAATTIGNYALFSGGQTDSTSAIANVDAYDTSLTKTTATAMGIRIYGHAATTVGNYALLGGGYTGIARSASTYAYNTSLTRSIPTALSAARYHLAATTVGGYALFGGGQTGNKDYSAVVDAYNTSLTRTTITTLNYPRIYVAATTVGNYALFGGGYNGSGVSAVVDAYNTSLTRTNPTALSTARRNLAATTVGNYALFGGGAVSDAVAIVDAYDASLTKTTPTALSYTMQMHAATTVGNYALFGGGLTASKPGSYFALNSVVNAYDLSLTQTIPTALSAERHQLAATTVGNYALFGGGSTSTGSYYSSMSTVVDVYTVA